jgi:hypothetical protein
MTTFYYLRFDIPPTWRGRNRVTRLYPQALGSLFVSSYDSQGYGGGILTRLHMMWLLFFHYEFGVDLGRDRIENTASNSFYIVAYVFVAMGNVFTKPLPNNCHFYWFHYSGFHMSCLIAPSLRLLSNLRNYNVGIVDGRALWIAPFRSGAMLISFIRVG